MDPEIVRWIMLLLPDFLSLIKTLAAGGDRDAEFRSFLEMQRKIVDAKAAEKFGPRT